MNAIKDQEVGVMELKDFVSRLADRKEALDTIAAKIRPLPENVVPSEKFIDETRMRLLQLRPAVSASRRAA
jgi:hypothetical protein